MQPWYYFCTQIFDARVPVGFEQILYPVANRTD